MQILIQVMLVAVLLYCINYHVYYFWGYQDTGYGRLFGGDWQQNFQSGTTRMLGIFYSVRGVHGEGADHENRVGVGSLY